MDSVLFSVRLFFGVFGAVAQLARASGLHPEGQEFESPQLHSRMSENITMLMYPRKRLDLSPWVIIRFFLFSLRAQRSHIQEKLLNLWQTTQVPRDDGTSIIPVFSVRSGFDLLLSALAFPPGTRIGVSGITISDMVTIIREHGLVPVALDIDRETLAINMNHLKRVSNCVSDKEIKIILFAHLFGAVTDITQLAHFCRERNIFLIEDCAQAFCGSDYLGHPRSDALLWSFGPLKTATALAGGILQLHSRHRILAQQIETLHERWPLQARLDYVQRIVKFSIQHFFSIPVIYTLFIRILAFFGIHYDQFISRVARSFPKDQLFSFIRCRPSTPLLHALFWRLSRYPLWKLEQRERQGMEFVSMLGVRDRVPGMCALRHTFWLFPCLIDRADSMIEVFRRHGIDASKLSTSLVCVSEHAEKDTPQAAHLMRDIIYFPHGYSLPKRYRRLLVGLFTSKISTDASSDMNEHAEYARMFRSYPVGMYRPSSIEELQELVSMARSQNLAITVSGCNKSHGGHTVWNHSIHIETDRISRIFGFDEKARLLTVEAGVTWRDILHYLQPLGYSPLVMQSSCDFSVGGSIAGGIHGRSLTASHIAEGISALEYIDYETGILQKAVKGSPAFRDIVGAFGWKGIIVRAVIHVVPNTLFSSEVIRIRTLELPNFLKKLPKEEMEVFFMGRPIFHLDYTFPEIIAYIWKQISREKLVIEPLDDRECDVLRDRTIFRFSLRHHGLVSARNRLEYVVGTSSNGKTFSRNALMCPPVSRLVFLEQRGVQERQHTQEFYIPIQYFEFFYHGASSILRQYRIVVAGATLRFVSRNTLISLSPTPDSDAISFMFYFHTPNRFEATQHSWACIVALTDLAFRCGGKPFLTYAIQQDPSQLFHAYPELARMVSETSMQTRFLSRLRSSEVL